MRDSSIDLSKLGRNKTLMIAGAVLLLFLLVVCLILWIPVLGGLVGDGELDIGGNNHDPVMEGTQWRPQSCEELLSKAMEATYQGCQSIGSNQVCYGNFNISAQLTDEAMAQFASLGDTIAVNQLVTLNTSPMEPEDNIWGIAVFKLQANLPGTIPGQNVTFLVFGDTGLYNYSGDMYSIYFSTGIGSVTCSQVC